MLHHKIAQITDKLINPSKAVISIANVPALISLHCPSTSSRFRSLVFAPTYAVHHQWHRLTRAAAYMYVQAEKRARKRKIAQKETCVFINKPMSQLMRFFHKRADNPCHDFLNAIGMLAIGRYF